MYQVHYSSGTVPGTLVVSTGIWYTKNVVFERETEQVELKKRLQSETKTFRELYVTWYIGAYLVWYDLFLARRLQSQVLVQ